jgi:hypothetical protein
MSADPWSSLSSLSHPPIPSFLPPPSLSFLCACVSADKVMAIGKNKKLGKKLKAGKKKQADPFTRKEWYDIKAPAAFTTRNAGTTPVSRTSGTHVASESLKGRVFTISLADLAVSVASSAAEALLPLCSHAPVVVGCAPFADGVFFSSHVSASFRQQSSAMRLRPILLTPPFPSPLPLHPPSTGQV